MGDTQENTNIYDVLVIGAGISGIDAAYRLKSAFPDSSYTLLESRCVLGGTWSFWQYPGFRSDSYMSGYAFPWYKWTEVRGIADGDAIWRYVDEAARSQGIDKKIKYSHRVVGASWSTAAALWTLIVDTPQGQQLFKANFVFNCSGYYDYETPFESPIPGLERFKGTVAVPQFWPQDLDYSGKKMIIIGSGATAITLLPSLAQKAGHITMLQRSPSYVLSVTAIRPIDRIGRKFLPETAVRFISYWTTLFTEVIFLGFLSNFPSAGKKLIMKLMAKQLPDDIHVDKHFNPSYNPFEQRLCMCPDGDFFKALRKPHVEIMTDFIDTVTPEGIRTKDGTFIEADIIVPATGLKINPVGGVPLEVDGKLVELGNRFTWRGCMVEGVSNAGVVLGYFSNSWTPGADCGVQQLVRVIKRMKKTGTTVVTPYMAPDEKDQDAQPFFDTNATYMVAARPRMPQVHKQGTWSGRRNWLRDCIGDWWNGIEKGLKYTGGKAKDT